ncbi:MAG: PAS domain S-box protein [Ignavibacteriaceae bacterium]
MSVTKKWFFNLPSKITLISSIFFGLLAIVVFIILTQKVQENLYSEFYKNTKIISDNLALNAKNELSIIERKRDYNSLTDSSQLKFIKYFVLTNDMDKILTSFNLSSADSNNYYNFAANEHLPINDGYKAFIFPLKKNDVVRNYVPILKKEEIIGRLYVGFLINDLRKKVNETRLNIGLFIAKVFGGCVLIIFIVSYILTFPLKKILVAAQKISSGKYSYRSAYNSESQLGVLSSYFNKMAEIIENSNSQVESLNKELKVIFRDKMGELNFEINQRRIAEFSLKKSEEQFRLLFELAPIGMFISTPDRIIKKVNQAFCKTVGYEEEELIKLNSAEITFPDDQIEDLARHSELLNNKIANINYEKRFITKDNKVIYAIIKSVLHRDEKNKPLHFIGQIIDITERKQSEQELISSKEKAEESDRLKTAFLAQMSHEIRTPLNIILNATPLIADEFSGGIDDETEILLDAVNSAGKRLQRTIDMILNMSSIQAGNYKADFEMIDLDIELRKLVEEFKPLCLEKNLNLFFYNKAADTRVFVDRYTIIQVFQNLIHNAIKYTIRGKLEVLIFRDEQKKVTVDIADTGIGMSKDYLQKLFHPFSQEDVGHKREFEGNGLGLALVKKYLELNKAEITVKSVKEVGSTFTVIFDNKSEQIV